MGSIQTDQIVSERPGNLFNDSVNYGWPLREKATRKTTMTATQPVSRPRNLVPAFQSAFRQTQSTCFNIQRRRQQRRPWNRFVNEIGSAHLHLLADALGLRCQRENMKKKVFWPGSMCQNPFIRFSSPSTACQYQHHQRCTHRAANIGRTNSFRPSGLPPPEKEKIPQKC
jgi:hypothetical protein